MIDSCALRLADARYGPAGAPSLHHGPASRATEYRSPWRGSPPWPMLEGVYDVAIVGAGPAGSAAALAARRAGATVLLLDRDDFPRDKPCGDGIAPQGLDVLAA